MRRHISRESLVIAAAGDISLVNLGHHLDQVFINLPPKGKVIEIKETKAVGANNVIIIDQKIPQSIVTFGHAGIKRNNPDWYITSIISHILGGGGFSSRLMQEIREKRGLAYGVYSYPEPYEHAGLYMGRVATANSQVSKSLKVIRAEWTKMADKGVTPTELAAAKSYINGSFPLRLDSTHRIASLLVSVQANNLGIDYLSKRSSLINDVTLSDIKRVAPKLLRPEALTVLIVGQPKGIKQTP